MSTDKQMISPQVQRDAIAAFAAEHGFGIVKTYADEGRSGLTLRERPGLSRLLGDVVSGAPGFGVLLVYDISRWGRFQDIDESAHYEFLCRRAGVKVIYCAEPFKNDGSPTSTVLKNLKRIMAGEYSRELSEKVARSKLRIVERGLHPGGTPGYGLRRMVIDAGGKPRGVVESGEQKFLVSDKVVIVPGPPEEVANVRWIFEQVVHGWPPGRIAAELNRRSIPRENGRPWSTGHVRTLLENERYIGSLVYNKGSTKLHTPRVEHPRETWSRIENAYPAAIEPELFYRAQAAMGYWSARVDNELALERLRALFKKHGRLSIGLIDSTPGMPCAGFYRDRFGGITRAYALVGYTPKRNYGYLAGFLDRQRRQRDFRGEVYRAMLHLGLTGQRESGKVLSISGIGRLAVISIYCIRLLPRPAWYCTLWTKRPVDWVLLVRYDATGKVKDYIVMRKARKIRFGYRAKAHAEEYFASTPDALLAKLATIYGIHRDPIPVPPVGSP